MSVAGCEMGLDRGETDRHTDKQVGTLTRRTAKHCKPCTLAPFPLRGDTWNNILQTRTVRYACRGFCLCHYACFSEEDPPPCPYERTVQRRQAPSFLAPSFNVSGPAVQIQGCRRSLFFFLHCS